MMRTATLLIFFICHFSISICQPTFCDKYCNITGLEARFWIRPVFPTPTPPTTITDIVYTDILNPGNDTELLQLHQYFNGTKPPGSTNYVGNPLIYVVSEGTGRILAGELGCNDGTIPPYTGSLETYHTGKQIGYYDYAIFNNLVCDSFRDFLSGYAGYDDNDIQQVGYGLDNWRSFVCMEADCTSICNKYSKPCVKTNNQLIHGIVTEFFTSINITLSNTTLNHVETYFGELLGCLDGSVDPYTGPNVTSILV
jgi:hypothetical protein